MAHLAQYKVQLLEEFERRTDSWSFGDFEQRLSELWPKSSYHDAKGIINAAHNEGQWPKTVKRYLLTNYQVHGNVSSEFNDTFADVVAAMSDQERREWGVA
ncbi:hypothetical protein ACIQUF_06755 [Pseudomonas sp. NPDC090233]|uniref:hypothetical protein n=1 Tax=Pseudomonas sp. NPDC090233 TaxID=3364479 RepID=UPI00383B68E0